MREREREREQGLDQGVYGLMGCVVSETMMAAMIPHDDQVPATSPSFALLFGHESYNRQDHRGEDDEKQTEDSILVHTIHHSSSKMKDEREPRRG